MRERRQMRRTDHVTNQKVTDVVIWCGERGLDPREVTVTSTHLVYYTPETDEEMAWADELQRRRDERSTRWEQKMYRNLAAKYGPIENLPELPEQ